MAKKQAKIKSSRKLEKSEVVENNPQNLATNEEGVASSDASQLPENSGGYQGDPVSVGIENEAEVTTSEQTGQEATSQPIKEATDYVCVPRSSLNQGNSGVETPVKEDELPAQEETEEEVKDEWTADEMTIEDSTKFSACAFTVIKNGETLSLLKIYVNPLGGEECRMEVVKENLDKDGAMELLKQYVAKDIFGKLA